MGTDVEKRREREEYIYMKMLSSCIIHANLNFPDFEMRPFDYKKTSMALLSNFSHDGATYSISPKKFYLFELYFKRHFTIFLRLIIYY